MGSGTTCSSSGSCLRIFNIRLDDICATFEGLYISWNPSLFGSCVTFHGSWQLENVEDLSQASTHHLRLDDQKTNDSAPHAHTNETNKNGRDSTETETWILLTRHLCDTRRTNEYIAINAQDDTVLRDPEHVALKVHFFLSAVYQIDTTGTPQRTEQLHKQHTPPFTHQNLQTPNLKFRLHISLLRRSI
ncbi:uncharacterized protein F5891DRAFT_985662 [Suillus fuscotomentosus]|uniref:Uncharacterized protein n=1 Tax=Suillus fuscotomentosus TaxID=1912939 RepID=A0AAD4DVX5_9AGAM|nr:uncharacterized protein F5891DRAFT_985662 [Suillus fuscotomentosus]KAG1893598.1 hypothetical protein F5891DRAFT_985662 [Suillus fuscotomentosus]